MKPEQVELLIDELILEGFPGARRDGIQLALERELGHLLREQGVPPNLQQEADIGRLEVGMEDLERGSAADLIGIRLARTLYGGVGG